MRGRRLVPWLLTLGLAIVTFAGVWQVLESSGREDRGSLLKPDSVPSEPTATLVARIRASWEPGDRLRMALLIVGLSLCAAAAWRAWRVEGLPARTLRRVALTLAILGASSLALGLLRARTHTPGWWSGTYVSEHDAGSGIGHEDFLGTDSPAGLLPLLTVGGVWLGLGAVLGLLSLIYARRAARAPIAALARSTSGRGGS